jgi:peptidoglycan hydrolase-like protein with peptidoglycan-binding domain
MRKFSIFVLVLFPVLALLSGCASTGSKEVGNLKNRVSALEERQDALEARSRAVSTDITYVSEVERPAPATVVTRSSVTSASMTKKDVQTALKRAGYYDGAIDGKIGPKTRKAITDFQADNKLKVDGIVGSQTRAALLKYLDR